MKKVDIISNIVARKGEALDTPSKDISKVNLSGYLLKSIWDKVFEIRTDSQGTEYIFGKLPVVTQYGITMYSGDGVDVPSLASGLPFDGRTIWYNPDTQQIEVIGGTGGGSGEGVSNFWDLSGIPSWITNSKPKYTYSEIEGTPDLTKYALVSQIPSLSGYATESWVKNQGYLTQHQDLSGYQPLITSSNKLAYSLVSGTPTSLKNPNALNFGSKSYDGSAKITLTASDLGALTSHQTIYTLTFASGTFASGKFTANSANKTINIPTTTSHISEGSNLYFTNARAVSALAETLKAYVTLGGTQTITGEKNFTGGLKINGSPIVYNSTKKYWKLEGDLLVTGGVTMYGSDSSFTPSTIMDAIAVDGTTISKSGGVLKVIGGVADSVAWANITGKPTFASVATSGKYSDLSGTPSSLPASDVYSWAKSATKPTYKWSEITSKPTWIGSSKPTYSYSEITGAISTTELQNYLTSNSYLNVTSGDNRYLKLSEYTDSNVLNKLKKVDGSDSGLDADLLDGVQLNELFTSLSSNSTDKVSITIGGVTKKLTTLYASYARNFTVVWNNPTSGTYDLNDFFGGYVRHYGSGGSLSNAPSSFGNGAVLALTNGVKGLSGQLAWNIVHNSTTNVTNNLWWRAADSTNGFTYSQWKQIAFTDSNVASATKLETARTIWGRSFDGTGNVSGSLTLDNNCYIRCTDTSGGIHNSFGLNANNQLLVGYGMYKAGYQTRIYGNEIRLHTGDSSSLAINSSGNVGIGTTSPSYKLHVIGDIGNENVRLRYSTSNPFLSLVRSTSSETWYVQAVSGYLAIGSISSASCKIDASGNFLSPAGITMYSDKRKKTILNHVELSLKDIANAPLIEHYYNSDDKKTTHVGSIAQYWANMNDWFCKLDSEGYYTMEIQNAALASAISIARELDRYETKTDKAIKKLKKRICELEEEVERLKSA